MANHDNRATHRIGAQVMHASGLVGTVTDHHISGLVLRPNPSDPGGPPIPVWVGEEELGANEDYTEDSISYCMKSALDGVERWVTDDSLMALTEAMADGSTR